VQRQRRRQRRWDVAAGAAGAVSLLAGVGAGWRWLYPRVEGWLVGRASGPDGAATVELEDALVVGLLETDELFAIQVYAHGFTARMSDVGVDRRTQEAVHELQLDPYVLSEEARERLRLWFDTREPLTGRLELVVSGGVEDLASLWLRDGDGVEMRSFGPGSERGQAAP